MGAPIQNDWFDRVLKRLFKLRQSLGLEVESSILPTAEMISALQPEIAWLRDERLWMLHLQQVGVAATNGLIELINPNANTSIFIVERVDVDTAGPHFFNTLNSIASGSTAAFARDTRISPANPNAKSNAVVQASTIASGNIPNGAARLEANAGYVWDVPIILAPGTKLQVWGGTVAQATDTTFYWRDKPPTGEELLG